MNLKKLDVKKLYVYSFALFYFIPILAIVLKLVNGVFSDTLFELFFIAINLIITAIIFIIPVIKKETKTITMFVITTLLVFFFGIGSMGIETNYFVVNFYGDKTFNKLPYLVMFGILIAQIIGVLIVSIINSVRKEDITNFDYKLDVVVNPPIIIVMNSLILVGYLASIITKVILRVPNKIIMIDLSLLIGYILLLGFTYIILKVVFKNRNKRAVFNSMIIIGIISIGLSIGVMFFNQPFLELKLTSLIIGVINILLVGINFIVTRKKEIKSDI